MQLIVERLTSLENANAVHGQIIIKNKITTSQLGSEKRFVTTDV